MYPGFPAKCNEKFFCQFVASWGFALWRDKDFAPFFDDRRIAQEVFADKKLFKKINRMLPHTPSMIKAIAEGRLGAGDVVRSILSIKNN